MLPGGQVKTDSMAKEHYKLGNKLTNESAFKTYIMKVQNDSGFVAYQSVELALESEYYVDPPSYKEIKKTSMSSRKLRKLIKKNPKLTEVTNNLLASDKNRYKNKLSFLWDKFLWDFRR